LRKELTKIKKKNRDKNIIFESLYAHEMDADIVIILRCRPDELKKRLKKKYKWKTKIVENVEAEFMGIITEEATEKHGKRKVFEIDTTKKSHRNTAFIIRLLSNRKSLRKYKTGQINWMKNKKLYKSISGVKR
jgi:adenylate kinase